MSEKRICVIGAGNWGKNHIKTLRKLGALAGIVETDQTRCREIQMEYPDIEIFNDVGRALEYNFDGFTVATPAETHFQIGYRLLIAGYPVLIEKPLALNSKDAETLVDLDQKKKNELLEFVKSMDRMPENVKDRLIKEINSGKVRLKTLRRLEKGMERN